MRRVYTDERFPGCEIVNDGSLVFEVRREGQLLETFTTWAPTLTEAIAGRRARDYFERLEFRQQEDATLYFKGSGKRENVTRLIDDLMAKERLEEDPRRRQVLRRQIVEAMAEEISVAAAVVNELIA